MSSDQTVEAVAEDAAGKSAEQKSKSKPKTKPKVSADGGDFETIKNLWPYIWPHDRRDLQFRVAIAMGYLILGKIVTILTPYTYKWLTDSLTGEGVANMDIGSSGWFQMHHDDGIMDGYLDTVETANRDMIITEFPQFVPGQTITFDESGMDGLVAAGSIDAMALNEPQTNNVF